MEKKEELEVLRKLLIIKARLECKHSIQAEHCDFCQGITREGKTIEEIITELETSGFLKKIRFGQRVGKIFGRTVFWVGKGLIAGGVGYVIYFVGKKIFAKEVRKGSK